MIITSLAIDPATPSTLYAAYGNHSTGSDCSASSCGGVFKSTDGGETWAAAQDGLSAAGDVRALVIDPRSPSTIYAVTQAGVFRSTDAATTWSAFNSGLPSLLVSSVSIDRTGTLLRAATASGLFEYQVSADGIGPEGSHTGMWWASPPGSESGWGINLNHQGDDDLRDLVHLWPRRQADVVRRACRFDAGGAEHVHRRPIHGHRPGLHHGRSRHGRPAKVGTIT